MLGEGPVDESLQAAMASRSPALQARYECLIM
jgi:hypothetical protein